MKFDLDQATIKLKPSGVIPLRDAAGSTVSVLWGNIWLTQEGDGRDYQLRGGESLVIRAGGLTLIDAFDTAAVTILEPCDERARSRTKRWNRSGSANRQRTSFESDHVRYIGASESQRYQWQAQELRAMYIERFAARTVRALARTLNGWREYLASSWEKGARALWQDERNRLWLP